MWPATSSARSRSSPAAEGSAIWMFGPVRVWMNLLPRDFIQRWRVGPSSFSKAFPWKPFARTVRRIRMSTKIGGSKPRLVSTASTASTSLEVWIAPAVVTPGKDHCGHQEFNSTASTASLPRQSAWRPPSSTSYSMPSNNDLGGGFCRFGYHNPTIVKMWGCEAMLPRKKYRAGASKSSHNLGFSCNFWQ